jgi:hypothetical protein
MTEIIEALKKVRKEEDAKKFLELYKSFVRGNLSESLMDTVCSRGICFLIKKHLTIVEGIKVKKHFEFFLEPSAFRRLQEM